MHGTFKPAAPVGLVHLALAVGGFAIGTTEFATMSLLPDFARSLRIDAPTAGHVISAYALGVVVGAPLLAVLAARLPRRTLLIGLMLLFAIGNALSGLAPSYGWMLAFRFLAGLPHGAYFGIASLVAASLVPVEKRTQAVARVLLGLTVATIVGVPLANLMGQVLGWRWCFAVVAALALLTAGLVWLYAPREGAPSDASPLKELSALGRAQVWLTLAVGAIGFGGLFAVYTYLADTMVAVTHVSPRLVPLALMAFGIGMTAGNLVVPRFADRALLPSAAAILVWSIVALALWPLAAQQFGTALVAMVAIGFGGSLATVLQTRLMDVAGDAQGLAAALNHSAFNVANALGPWLGGLAIAAGYGWTSTGWVGAGLAAGGLAMLGVSVAVGRRRKLLNRTRNEPG
ncbi:MFS transporter [Sphingomonas aracearum]|uniref:MFS transporter n=1 Tax=Sphingomonas aracearum TaxID=2283317 RepID=A0A369W2B8_9SPHN|nr:MFS transporter [Sphingomonas aracearum]RDE07510.1 MFS transporter [Sphingomonas aracearum]